MKDKYIEDINQRFQGKAKELLLEQVNLFYDDSNIIHKNQYEVGQDVILTKGTFIHGIFGELDKFDFTIKNGFIATDFTQAKRTNKICNSVGFWNIKEDILLKDYIHQYSGFTITYHIGRGPESQKVSELVPYHQFDQVTEIINDNDKIWSYSGEQTKEVRFIPSLVANKRQIAFILNMDSDYAKSLAKHDVWNLEYDEETLTPFLDSRYVEQFLTQDRLKRDASTTDRESAIMFGLPAKLIEGVFVGRKIEKNTEAIAYIHSQLPDCYICNLDGKIIIGNKKD